jgi:heterodisulfide reductase subunit C
MVMDRIGHARERNEAGGSASQDRLKCPYCDEVLPSHRDLRVHVGATHREKTDDFMEEYFGGRWIEADFVTLMLKRVLGDINEESCRRCGKCTVGCSIPQVYEGYPPYMVPLKVQSGEVKELLKSDVIWACTSCLFCGEQCPASMSPYEVISVLQNLSARIGYHFPREYRDLDKNIFKMGVVQEPQVVRSRTAERLEREGLDLPGLQAPSDMGKFKEALNKLSAMRVVL